MATIMASSSSSIGSDIFALLSLIIISISVLLLLRHYLPLRSTPGYLLVPVFLALALPCSIILLVPIDLASSDGAKRGVWLPDGVVLTTWRITYWLTFVLTWFILPFLGEYCDSGFRDTRARVIYSLRSNARYQLITFGTAIAGLVYFILTNGFHGQSIKGLVMALAYAWGLVLAIGLMGHGLVALPRRLFKDARISDRLRRLQAQAPKTKDRLDDALEELETVESTVLQLKQRKTGISKIMQEWIDELADSVAMPTPGRGGAAGVRAPTASVPAVVTERYLAELTRKLKRARHKRARFVDEWANLCQAAQDSQTILDSVANQKLDSQQSSTSSRKVTLLTPKLRFHLHYHVFPYLRIAFSAICAAASVLIIWSEVISSFAPRLSVIGLTVVYHPGTTKSSVPLSGQLTAAAWLLYMCSVALYAISDVKVWGNRALVKRQTYAESACWYSLQVAKLTVPLSYNFITLMPRDVLLSTSFYNFLGKLINLTPLGNGFSNFFPCFILIPVLSTLFNFYGKVSNVIGFGVLEDDSEDNLSGFGTGGWREGKALIDRELQSRSSDSTALDTRGASLDLERGASSNAPLLSNSTSAPSSRSRDANRQFNDVTNQEEDVEDSSARSFYQDFGERVRNTLDSAPRPDWLQTPKWLQTESDGGSPLKRWFGGRAENGRLRL